MKELADRGFTDLHGMDVSAQMIELSRKNLGDRAQLSVSTGSDLAWGNETLDAVLLVAVLTCVTDIDFELRMISEVQRVLKPGGIVCVNDLLISNRGRKYTFESDALGEKAIFLADGRQPVKHCSEDRFRAQFSDFDILYWQTMEWTSMNGNPDTGVSFVARKRI